MRARNPWPDRLVRRLLAGMALSAVIIVLLIMLFIFREGWPAFREVGLWGLLRDSTWRPGEGRFGLQAMILGSLLVTAGALGFGVPLALGNALFLAEVASPRVRALVRPAVDLLAGIPSVVYGLFGMVVLVPLVRRIPVAGNSGYGLLSASLVLAVMILPTMAGIAEDALRAVPRDYREGALALGATRWQTIVGVTLPAARSGLIAAVILGIGRALGETMAMLMVIGNAVVIPAPLDGRLWTLMLSPARTLTGNIAVEINYAAGLHAHALFATGVVLFIFVMGVNALARLFIRRGGGR